jgi:hypothetical protein
VLVWSFRLHRVGRLETVIPRSAPIDSQPLAPSTSLHRRDLVALATTACLVSTVFFLHIKVLPWYVAVMEQGGFLMPLPLRVARWLLNSPYIFWGLFFWALFLLFRRRRAAHRLPFPLPRVLAVVNVLAVVALMALSSGFVGFAMHGFKAVRNVITAQEQARAEHAAQPARIPQR